MPQGIPNTMPISIEELERRLQSGESLRAIGRDIGVSHTTLQYHRSKAGMPKLKQGLVRGENHAQWKGGRYVDKWGYTRIYAPENGRAFPYVYEHTLVAEGAIGRRITPGEVVHHINGDKLNNTPENLLVLSRSDHKRLHAQLETLAYELVRSGAIVFDGESYHWSE